MRYLLFGKNIDFSQRLFAALSGTSGSYLRDALQEGSVDDVACLLAPRAKFFSPFFLSLGGLHCFFL
jgi:hypothetical protein